MKTSMVVSNHATRSVRAGVATLLILYSCLPAFAQQPAPAVATPRPQYERVVVTSGRSIVVPTDFDVTRIAITNAEIADALVVQPREILVDGRKSGTVSLIAWGGTDTRRQYDIVVEPAITVLEQQLQALFPGEAIAVSVSEEAIVLSGLVSSTAVMLRAGEIATSSSAKSKVINMLQVPGGNASQQVMLQVRFAEVNRKALTELGINLFVNRDRFAARSTTQQFSAPVLDDGKPNGLTFSDFLNLFFFDKKEGIGAVVKALESKGGFQSLAEPNLIAYNGQQASFLAGGEFPVPIAQGGTSNAVTVEYREFGIRLNFTPTIAGDLIRLKVRPEVSSLDFANGVTLNGFRIPALTTRRAETDVELRDGQSFAIAGLLDNVSQDDTAGIPFLSKLPIIGYLFKSKAERKEETELMVLITPRLVRPLDPDEVPALPTNIKPLVERGDIGQQLDGAAGIADAPSGKKNVTDSAKR